MNTHGFSKRFLRLAPPSGQRRLASPLSTLKQAEFSVRNWPEGWSDPPQMALGFFSSEVVFLLLPFTQELENPHTSDPARPGRPNDLPYVVSPPAFSTPKPPLISPRRRRIAPRISLCLL